MSRRTPLFLIESDGSAARRLRASDAVSPARATGPSFRPANPVGAPLASLAGGALARRFCAWRGGAGRRYVTTVFGADDPGWRYFDEAVLILAIRDASGARRPLAVEVDPSPARRARLVEAILNAPEAAALEVHLHLIAGARGAREAAALDLSAGRFFN